MENMIMDYFATMGPNCYKTETIEALINAGMTGRRLNLSHSSLADKAEWIDNLHTAEERTRKKLKFLIDLQGRELRINIKEDKLILNEGNIYTIGISNDCDIVVPEIMLSYFKEGQVLSLNDGVIQMEMVKIISNSSFKCLCKSGGELISGKSIAIKDQPIDMCPVSDADLANLKDAKKYGVNGIMQSFVYSKEDIIKLKNILNDYGLSDLLIYAKIECPEAIKNIDSIIDAADCIIIARGDLGNTMGLAAVPPLQKRIAQKCRDKGKPFMVVTEMLKSMIENKTPSRAEMSDIYNAILDGADSLMLTGETAVGKYPLEAMKALTSFSRI